jgi:hypothetical protein
MGYRNIVAVPMLPPPKSDSVADLPLTRFQVTVIAVMILLNALDGYDALAIAFAAPGIAREWSVAPGALPV